MKNIAKILAAVMVLSLIVAVCSISPAALNSSDWEIVHHPTGNPANAVVETTPNNGIRLSHEGHYPSSNAGLLYTQPLNVKEGISLNVTVETNNGNSADTWYGICLMNRPVYFDVTNTDVDSGFGIVLLCRPADQFQWFTVSEAGFAQATTWSPSSDKEYYSDEGVTIDFDIKFEDGALNIYVDGEDVGYDFAEDLLPYLIDDQAYIGFSMSMTELELQSFVINYLNGQQPASEGEAITKAEGGETTADADDIDFENVDKFTLKDFTQPDSINGITTNDCKISFDEVEGALKVEVTGADPFFNIPMKKKMYFDGDKFYMIKMEYKTEFEGTSEFFYTTKEVPSMAYCNLQYDLEATGGEYKILEYDMQESENWTGEIRNFRVDPAAAGEEGQVFYYKSISFEVGEEPVTEPPTTTAATTTEAEPTTDAETDATTDAATEADGKTTDAVTDGGSSSAPATSNGVPFWVWIIIGAVCVVVIVVIIIAVSKKKK
ncbi:MAG: hypothetical protein IJT49_08475 [Clostridia bacterium]|nr:hypothetical protein [Clostridia bacterium]